jgi:hypothetical protein
MLEQAPAVGAVKLAIEALDLPDASAGAAT